MNCKSKVSPALARRIQQIEQLIRKTSEARVHELELAVMEAMTSGLEIKDMRITEVIEWTDKQFVFKHSVKIERKA